LSNHKRRRTPTLTSQLLNTDTADLVREARELGDLIRDLRDDFDADAAEVAEMNQCMSDMAQLPPDDPRHVAAQDRFNYLLSPAPQAKRKFQRALKNFTRSIGNELYYLTLAARRWLLVLGFNAAAAWLFFWLLSLL
jgi:hypothetical protein